MDYLLCGNLPYPAWKKHISVQNLSNRRIRRYLVCRLKRPEARDFSHVRFTGYETMSENYKILMQRGEIEKEAAEKAIRVYDFLAGCDTDDLCEMIDSSAFNDLIRAFLVRAVTSAGLDDDTIDQIMQQLRYIFDGQTAKEVLEAHLA